MLSALLALVGCTSVNTIVPLGDFGELRDPASVLWTDGPWYDTGDIALLLLSSGTVSCPELQDIALLTAEDSTVFHDEGILMTLRRTRLTSDAAEAPPWVGEWSAAGQSEAWSWTLESAVFYGEQLYDAPAADAWMSVTAYDGGGSVEGSLENGWYGASFQAEHCNEMQTYTYY